MNEQGVWSGVLVLVATVIIALIISCGAILWTEAVLK